MGKKKRKDYNKIKLIFPMTDGINYDKKEKEFSLRLSREGKILILEGEKIWHFTFIPLLRLPALLNVFNKRIKFTNKSLYLKLYSTFTRLPGSFEHWEVVDS
jgi:hypothetical protein